MMIIVDNMSVRVNLNTGPKASSVSTFATIDHCKPCRSTGP